MYTTQQPQRPQRPKLPSFGAYESTLSSPQSSPGTLLTSCHTLQSVLTAPTPPAQSPVRDTSILGPASQPSPLISRCRLQSPAPVITPPPNSTKRKRNDEDEDDVMELDELPEPIQTQDIFKTPKRQRRMPVNLPLGLGAADFDALCMPEVPRELDQMDCDQPIPMQHLTDLQRYPSRHPQNLKGPGVRPPDDAYQLFEPTLNQVQPLQA